MVCNHKIWNKEKIKKLTPLQYGRVKKVLEELYRFDNGVMELKERIEKGDIIKRYKISDSRKKYNVMYSKNGREVFFNIPKIVYDLIDLEEEVF